MNGRSSTAAPGGHEDSFSSPAGSLARRLGGRILFELALLAIAVWYAAGSFRLSAYTPAGKLGGAGLFPQMLAIGLIVALIAAIVQDTRAALRDPAHGSRETGDFTYHVGQLLLQMLLLAAFLYLFIAVSAWIAAAVYIVVGMATIERPVRPLAIGVALAATFALFYVMVGLLNATLP